MTRRNVFKFLPSAVIALALLFPRPGVCRLNLPELEGQTMIEGGEHETLKDFLGHYPQDVMPQLPEGEVKQILLRALPEAYKKGCADMVAHWGPAAGGAEAMSVRLLHVEAGGAGKPQQALLAYACFSRAKEYGSQFMDERLAALTVERKESRLSMMPDDADCEDCPALTRIRPENEVHIGGKCVVGLNVLKTSENPCCTLARTVKEERVDFYLMQDNGDAVKRAGWVLKARDPYILGGDADDGKTVYNASIIFKKDMKGNIIGVLSPYTLATNGKRSGKGMVRYDWNSERKEFMKE
jgi:hypothetical protein